MKTREIVDNCGEVSTMQRMDRTQGTKEVAAALGVTASTVQLYSRDHRIPFDVTPGGHRRYNVDEVRASLENSTGSLLTSLGGPRIGAGVPVVRSEMAVMDAARRAVVGESLAPAEDGSEHAESAAVEFIKRSRRVLVSL